MRVLEKAKTLAKLEGFSQLAHGWHYGKGGPIDRNVIEKTESMYYLMVSLGIARTNVFPGQDGEVLLGAYKGEDYIGVIIEPDFTASVTHEIGDDTQYYNEFSSVLEARAAVRKLVEKVCNTSVQFTPRISISTAISSATWCLKSHRTVGCLSSKDSVGKRRAGQSAAT